MTSPEHAPSRPVTIISRTALGTGLVAAALLAALVGLGGCVTSERTATEIEPYTALYEKRKYAEAQKSAELTARDTNQAPAVREKAQMVAGLAAYASGKQDVAATYMRPLQTNADRQIAGRASWTLGQIEAERGKNADAAKQFVHAGGLLDGDDAGQAYLQAGDSYARLKMIDRAKEQWSTGRGKAQSAALIATLDARISGGSVPPIAVTDGKAAAAPAQTTSGAAPAFAVQLGAFEKRETADALAKQQAATAKKMSVATPQVFLITDQTTGRSLYAVRVGEYQTRDAAQTVATLMGGTARVVKR
ncbi:MAG: SPOR domain-containing protein [Phycisphaerales bacterium]